MWFGVLGAVTAGADTPIALTSARQRVLLAMLICHHGHVVSIDRLVEAIWEEDEEPQRGKAALQTVVSRLRSAIAAAGGDPRAIASDDTGYRLLADASKIDATRFESLLGEGSAYLQSGAIDLAEQALSQGLALFRGHPYAEFSHCDWARGEATRLSERRADASELLAEAILDRGGHREAIPQLEAALGANPYREGLQTALMTALYRSGRHSDAVRSYQTFRTTILDDLGLEPSPELREHEGRVLRHDPALDAPSNGRPLRGYRLHEPLVTNHLGTVWRATQPGVGREVAVTTLSAESPLAANIVADFDATARALGRLDHPNVAGVVDAWTDASGSYLVSRLARGSTLAELVRTQPPTPADAERLIAHVRAAVDHAHANNVAHGALDASAVTVDADHNAHVTGWGVVATDELVAADLAAVDALADQLGVAAPLPTGSRPNPYRGLAAFQEGEAKWFFGREHTLATLIERLAEQRLVTVIGASGSGKSSLLRAGLAAAVQSGEVETCRGWDVVIIDPLEDLFTVADGEQSISALVELVEDRTSPVRVVAALRSDQLDPALSHPTLGPLIGPSLLPIVPMTASELQQAIAMPASAVGASVDEALIAELVTDIVARPNALPLLQFALTELFDRTGGDDLTLPAFRAMGGLEGAIARVAESVFDSLSDVDQSHVRGIFAQLVATNADGAWIRRRVAVSDLIGDAGSSDVLDAFVAARLLTVEVDPISREPLVSMTHDALGREWPRLAGWMESDRQAIADLRELRGAIDAWTQADRDPDRLMRGAALARASAAAEERPGLLTRDERQFLTASTEHATKARRRERRVTVVVAVLATFAVLGAIVALVQRQDARTSAEAERTARAEADLGRLALQAQVLAGGPTDLALLLAVESWRRQPDTASEAALLAALAARPLIDRYVAPDSPTDTAIESIDLTAAGQLVVRRADRIELRDATTFERGDVAIDVDPTDTIAVRHDGSEVAIASNDGRIRRWDLATGQPIFGAVTVARNTAAPAITYAEDGRIVAAHPDDGLVVIDFTSGTATHLPVGQPISRFAADPWSPHVVAASESSTYLVSIDGTAAVDVLTGLGGAQQMSYSADGQRLFVLASQSEAGSLFELDATTLRPHGPLVDGFDTLRDAYIPLRYPSALLELDDSRVIVAGYLGRAVILDPTWRSATVVDLGTRVALTRPDGLLIGSSDSALTVVDVDGQGALGRPLTDDRARAGTSSADGTLLAAQTGAVTTVRSVITGDTHEVTNSRDVVGDPYLSPDGSLLAVGSTFEVEFIDVATNTPLGNQITTVGAPPSFSPDGSLVAVPGFVGVVIFALPSLHVIAAVPPTESGDRVTDISWSPDGSRLAITSQRSASRVVDAASGSTIAIGTGFETGTQLRWSSDGTMIAVIASDRDSRIVDATTGAVVRLLPSVRGPVELAGWFRDDQRLIVIGAAEPNDAVAELIDVASGQQIGPPIRVANLASLVRGRGRVNNTEMLLFPIGTAAESITLDPTEWTRLACEVAGRNLTESEWAAHMSSFGPWRQTCPDIP